MFENNGYVHVYSPGVVADNPLRSFFSLTVLTQGQPRVIIYINFVEFESIMLHAKFQ